MKKFIVLIPVYNDWDSLSKLFCEINKTIKDISNAEFNCFVINDASTISSPVIKKPSNIKTIKIINLKKNTGHARCNAFGIRYIINNEKFDHLIVMDGDGEDRPQEIKSLVSKALSNEKKSVVAKRIKRSEGFLFQFLYSIHKMITLFFTGKKINFGNYSCLTKKDVEILSTKPSLWSSFSGSVKLHLSELNEINSIRGLRYFGPSKMSLLNLCLHSFAIIAVFKTAVFTRSSILIIIFFYFSSLENQLFILIQITLVLFNLLIYIISRRENERDLLDCHLNMKDLVHIT